MVAPGAAPAASSRRALPQDGAGQAAALAVRGQGGPGGSPGRRLGLRGAARAEPAATDPRRGLRGQRRGPEVGERAGTPRTAARRGFASLPLASARGLLGCACRVACSRGKGRAARVSLGTPAQTPGHPLSPASPGAPLGPPVPYCCQTPSAVSLQVRVGGQKRVGTCVRVDRRLLPQPRPTGDPTHEGSRGRLGEAGPAPVSPLER